MITQKKIRNQPSDRWPRVSIDNKATFHHLRETQQHNQLTLGTDRPMVAVMLILNARQGKARQQLPLRATPYVARCKNKF
ncbi:uncharacterized protein RCC_03249 [Ramularia collo-cygni]|uniref:Uncharacterized protein n=1 Tax=Ramularia collo-cygni TaxID=112498 RepID=A0A2D3UTW8_9PEZI|nr:uncharacterized protein RCC_03249 [Ramularia collo-cygni]CZT17415.1 uncharacterized protein RCC_03249 [Ramularia collo-cygni]